MRDRNVDVLLEGVRSGDRAALGRAITLIESTREADRSTAQDLLGALLPRSEGALRVGITGVPGVGKSTFIEVLGGRILEDDERRVAVLAVDPTSTRSGGSILGDKTRMRRLAGDPRVFIRPSPSGPIAGGVARRTREALLVCEAAGYDTIFVETVGVGQAETAVHGMVDYFLLLVLAGAGDELQGIKRGIVEMADGIAVTKAEGDNQAAAEAARRAFQSALQLFPPMPSGWEPPVHT
ncbi:MAG: methylmalonyl Co-A mutase-associated GTPase MeaB, partial [Rhodothermales bacterium]